jgi:hypothetical protein
MAPRTDVACPEGESQVVPSTPSEVRLHLRRILDSPHFVHAHQLQQFLEHLVEAALEGRADDLKEYSLGRDVFRRGESYDPRNDAIVRVQASILRKRLTAYYENGGKADRIRIELPKGSYVPHFVSPPEPEAGSEESLAASPERSLAVATPQRPSRRNILGLAATFAAGAATTAGLVFFSQTRSDRSGTAAKPAFAARNVSPRVWAPLLSGDKPIQLAFGCPQFFRGGGLYIRDVNVNNTQAEAANRRLQELTRQLGQYLVPSPNTYTGVGEIMGVYRMTQFVTHQGIDSQLENIQLLTPELVRDKHLILVSSYRFRTLIDLLTLPRAFEPDFDGSGAIAFKEPAPGQPKRYAPVSSGGVSRSYGLVSYWTRPETGGRILMMSGIESWATLGTVEFITGEQYLSDLESRLARDFTKESKGLEVLVEIQGHEDRPISVRYVTHRVLA